MGHDPNIVLSSIFYGHDGLYYYQHDDYVTANISNYEGKCLKGLIVFFFKLIGIPLGIIFYSV